MSQQSLIEVLMDALRQWKCPACGGRKTYLNRVYSPEQEKIVNAMVPCKKCEGSGLHPTAIGAIELYTYSD